ncbi:MAG: hypothetical protein ACLRNQ_23250 [Flavonifractor plautii]
MKVKVAAIQMSADIGGREANVERAERSADSGGQAGGRSLRAAGAGAG